MPLAIALMAILTLICGSVTIGLTVTHVRTVVSDNHQLDMRLSERDDKLAALHGDVEQAHYDLARKQLEFDTLKALARRLTEKTMAMAPVESRAEAVGTMWGYVGGSEDWQGAQHASQATDAP